MAFFADFSLNLGVDDVTELEEIANRFLNPTGSSSSSPRDSGDSEGELLPDEPTVDLIKFLDSEGQDFEGSDLSRSLLCDAECTKCSKNPGHLNLKSKVSARDPFMGSVPLSRSGAGTEMNTSASFLGQIMSPLGLVEEQLPNSCSVTNSQNTFNAWSHTSNADEYQVYTKSSFSTMYPEEDAEETFPDTPSTLSDQGVTDDSDVDIETVTDAPRSVDLFAGSSRSTSPSPMSSPCMSPLPTQSLQKGSLMSILSQSTAGANRLTSPASPGTKSLLRFGVSSSASLAENLMAGRSHSISGQKRRLQKEKRLAAKMPSSPSSSNCVTNSQYNNPISVQATYSHVLVNSNSVNFHDYAMSPESCTSPIETGRPTVMSKRLYRKRQYASLDISDKEKQHHHNQLERNRRQKLADLFTDLRDEIPKIQSHSKASKVVILNDATEYIRDLKRLEVHQESEKETLLQKQILLKEQLRRLQGSYSLLS